MKNNKLEIKSNVIIEEYKSLKSEIQDRLKSGQQITNLSIIFSVGIISFLELLKKDIIIPSSYIGDFLPYSYLISAIVSSCFGLMYLGEDISIAHLATYINQKLRPHMISILQEKSKNKNSIWGWEDFRSKQQFRMPMIILGVPINSSKYILTIAPSIILFIAYLMSRNYSIRITLLEIILLIIFTIFIIMLLVLLIYEAIIYKNISKKLAN
jgi:hypothetical protein